MKILVSNDDGYFAPGITLLAEALRQMGEVTVVAPERDRSGASNSLTLDRPLTVRRAPNGYFSVNGTPTDCVHIAVTGLLDFVPDVIVSGVNLGANMGDDTIYSGTVAAAAEGYLLGIPSVALSLTSPAGEHFETAIGIGLQIVERLKRKRLSEPVLLNVNVPDVPAAMLRGIEVTRLGRRHKAEPVVKLNTPRGETAYWIGPAGAAADAGPGTDFHAVEAGRVSVTPLRMDLTHTAQLPGTKEWMTQGRGRPASAWCRRGHLAAWHSACAVRASATRACSTRWRPCRGTCSSRRRSPAAPTKTPRCRSASARPSLSPTWSRRWRRRCSPGRLPAGFSR